jgi:pimeloyl-ACP methyl ester carboxylesterase
MLTTTVARRVTDVNVARPRRLRTMTSVAARLTPRLAGRLATDAFSVTRTPGVAPDDVVPLGARRVAVTGDPDVTSAFVWEADGVGGAGPYGGTAPPEGTGGPTALLVHGWRVDSSCMSPLVAPLRRLGLRVAAFDAPGHGIWPGTQATMAEMARAAGNVADTLGNVRVVVAHSVGCLAALSAIARRPGLRLDAVVLVSPVADLSHVVERWAVAERGLARAVVDEMYCELAERNGVPTSHWDVGVLGPGLDAPVLVAHDPDDDVVAYSEGELTAAAFGAPPVVPLPGGGHWRALASPVLAAAVTEFLTKHVLSVPEHRGSGR